MPCSFTFICAFLCLWIQLVIFHGTHEYFPFNKKQKNPKQTSEKPHALLFCLMPFSVLPPGLLILARIASSFPSNSQRFLAGQDKFFPSLAFVWPYGFLPGIPSISPYESITPQSSLPYYFLSSKALWVFFPSLLNVPCANTLNQ